jgi:hypothetical protein
MTDAEFQGLRERVLPPKNPRARRRRTRNGVALIKDNYVYALDDVTDAIWRACDGRTSEEQAAAVLVKSHLVGATDALHVVQTAVACFAQNELVMAPGAEP